MLVHQTFKNVVPICVASSKFQSGANFFSSIFKNGILNLIIFFSTLLEFPPSESVITKLSIWQGTIHTLRQHVFRIFGPFPLRKHVFSTENKQRLAFCHPFPPTSVYVVYEWSLGIFKWTLF